jgi:hypothetical protein
MALSLPSSSLGNKATTGPERITVCKFLVLLSHPGAEEGPSVTRLNHILNTEGSRRAKGRTKVVYLSAECLESSGGVRGSRDLRLERRFYTAIKRQASSLG